MVQCLLVFREGRPFSRFLVEKVDTHETLAGIVPKAEKLVRGPFVDPPSGCHFGAQNAPISKTSQKKSIQKQFRATNPQKTRKTEENGTLRSLKSILSLKRRSHFRKLQGVRFRLHFGSILESFWEPSLLLYSFLVALVAETGSKKSTKKKYVPKSCS